MRVITFAPRGWEETVRTGHSGEPFVVVVEILQHGSAPVLHVVKALSLSRLLASGAEHGKQNRRQDGNDGYHHEQLNQGEATIAKFGEASPQVRAVSR